MPAFFHPIVLVLSENTLTPSRLISLHHCNVYHHAFNHDKQRTIFYLSD